MLTSQFRVHTLPLSNTVRACPVLIIFTHSTFTRVLSSTNSLMLSKTKIIKSCASFYTFVRLSFTMNSLMLTTTSLIRINLTDYIYKISLQYKLSDVQKGINNN